MPHPLIKRIEAVMKEASSISAAIGKDLGSHPSMYAMNRAWHALAAARDGLDTARFTPDLTNAELIDRIKSLPDNGLTPR